MPLQIVKYDTLRGNPKFCQKFQDGQMCSEKIMVRVWSGLFREH